MRFLRYLIFFFVALFFSVSASAQSSADLKRKKASLTKEIDQLNKSLKVTAGSKKLSQKQINALNAQIRLREEKINTINDEVKLLDDQIENNTHTVSALQSQLSKLKKEYAKMVLFAFRNRSAYNKLMFVFASADFNQAYMRLKYLSQVGNYRMRQAKMIEETQQNLHARINELDHNKKEKSSLLQDEEQEKQTLGKQKDKQSQVLSKLSKQEQQLQQKLATKRRDAARLDLAIKNAINAEIAAARKRAAAAAAAKAKADAAKAAAAKKANPKAPVAKPAAPKPATSNSGVLTATPESAKLSADFASNKGKLPWPVANGTIAEGFGRNKYGVNVIVDNNGINIKTSSGASVRAVFDGVVSTVKDLGGNYFVIIRHGDYFTVYSNLRSVSVSAGQKVSTRATLGTVLTDPFTNNPEVHFEIHKGVLTLNPSLWIAK
ncbi:MAG: peptidoglycan DD-metalloendopeptidase family protein [Sphingobacteriaceae bacterium]|jgi:septal ring factor EnvC (AmiA/AmiB activator)|nr:peptidoglycan DD-metalloendopeptidase family protein [Sphingobacteriaceae bacterium]